MADSPEKDPANGDISQSGITPVQKTAARKPENARGSLHKASPKNGIPPKRINATNETRTNPTTPNASRSTVSSASRHTPKGSLTKPPTRPRSKADSDGLHASASSPGPAVVGRKAKNSVSSADGSTIQNRGLLNGRDEEIENKPPPSTERAGSTSPVKSILSRSSLAFSVTTGKRPHSTLAQSSKAAMTRGLDEARMRSGKDPSRNGRTATHTTQAKAIPNRPITKRSSNGSISSQAQTVSSEPTGTVLNRNLTSPKRMRPGLGPRKSTMSVTIEQRLREMSLVHQMLRAAMVEDGDEDDEVKEEYGKQMDDTLAALKARLKEAKRDEGLVDSEAESETKQVTAEDRNRSVDIDGEVANATDDNRTGAEPVENNSGAKDASEIRQREEALLEQLEGVDVSAMKEITHPELRVTKLELLKARGDYETLYLSKDQETTSLREATEFLTSRLHNMQASHQSIERELARLAELNNDLESRARDHESNKDREAHYYEVTLQEIRERHSQLVENKDNEILASHQAAHILEDQLREVQESRQRAEEDARILSTSLNERIQALQQSSTLEQSHHREATEALESRLEQYENAKVGYLEEHGQVVAALRRELYEAHANRDREVKHQQEAIEALQDRIGDLNETKERELEAVKQALAKEHEEAVATLQLELDNAVTRKHEDSEGSDDSSVEVLKKTFQSQFDQLRATLASVHSSNTGLRQDLDEQKQRHKEALSDLEMDLAHSVAESDNLRAEMETLRQRCTNADTERNVAQSTLQSNEKALKDMSDNVADLQQQLTALNDEVTVLSEKNAGAEQELAATKKLLDDVREGNQQLSAGHKSEHERLRELRAELEYRAFKAQEACDDLELERVTSISRIETLHTELAESKSRHEGVDQEIATLRAEIQAANQAKMELASTSEKAKESYKMQVRELESALKVTTAELVELRTDRPSNGSYSGRPIPTSGFRLSRWAKTDGSGSGEGDKALVGEDLSSHIQGQV
ncbi:MAG: hypothetical protein Q9196_005291 [Gyalolechia fulgens]